MHASQENPVFVNCLKNAKLDACLIGQKYTQRDLAPGRDTPNDHLINVFEN